MAAARDSLQGSVRPPLFAMARTLRSHLKRWMLWRRASGRCEKCGKELPEKWHAHHPYPWTLTRRTSLNEMQALCPDCNLKLGDRMDLYDENGLRLGQRLGLRRILQRLGEGKSFTAIVMATRYGKSDLQRITAVISQETRMSCAALSLSPTDFLTGQMDNNDKWQSLVDRTKLQVAPKHARINAAVMKPNINGEHLLSTTIQFFQRNLEYWKDWARDERRRTGLPVILFVDESHTNSILNQWGAAVTEWQRYTGGHVVLLTATPERADETRIPGFDYSMDDVEDVVVTKTRPGKTPEKIRVDIYDGKRAVLNLIPHENITFDQAWKEEVLCHVEHYPFDVNLDEVLGGNVAQGMLSAIKNQQEIQRAISKCVRSPLVMRAGCAMALERLKSFRAIDPKTALIVFCGNDLEIKNDADYNKHANDISRIIQELDPTVKPVIATSQNEGRDELEAFAAGNGGGLLVKQMAGLGLDVSRLKVGLDLSPVRTKAAVIQRMMRIATPHLIGRGRQLLISVWVTPADLLMAAIYQAVVVANNGQATTMDLQLLRSYEKDREEGPEKPTYIPTGTQGTGARDTRGNIATEPELDQYVKDVLDMFPELGAVLTQPEIAARQRAGQQQANGGAQAQSTGAQVQTLRDEINDFAKTAINARLPRAYNPKDKAAKNMYGQISTELWTIAKQACNVPLKWELKQINDLNTLKALRAIWREMAYGKNTPGS